MRLTKRMLSLAGAAGLGLAAIAGAGTAGAASVPVTFDITAGTLGIGGTELAFPGGATFTGTWDDETGALSGTLSLPSITLDITDPIPATINVTATQAGPATGTISPVDGTGNLTVTLNISLGSALLPEGCGIDGITMTLSTSGPGGSPLNFETGALGLGQSGFTVPQVNDACGALGALINSTLNLGQANGTISLTLQQRGVSTTPTTEAPVDTEPPVAPEDTEAPDLGGGATLPPTGASDASGAMALVALTIVALGAGLVAVTRRRSTV